jgi:hypothetical protein
LQETKIRKVKTAQGRDDRILTLSTTGFHSGYNTIVLRQKKGGIRVEREVMESN